MAELGQEKSNLEPELGGIFRDNLARSGKEPELGGYNPAKGGCTWMK